MVVFKPFTTILLFISILASTLFVPTTTLSATKEKKSSPWHEIEREIDLPAEEIFNELSNCKNYSKLFLFLDKSLSLYKKKGGPNKGVKIHVCYFETKAPTGILWSKFQVSSVKTGMNTYKILGKALQKNFKTVNLEWEITELTSNRTKLRGKFRIDPSLPFPDKMVQRYAKRSFKRVFYLFILRKY